LLKEASDRGALASAWLNLGAAEGQLGNAAEAKVWIKKAADAFRRLGIPAEQVRADWTLGYVLGMHGSGPRGAALLRQARRAFDDLKMPLEAGFVADVGTWARAFAAPEERTTGLVRRLIHEARARHERVPLDALTMLDLAVEITESLVPRGLHMEGELWKERGNALRHLGRYPEALRALDRADRAYGQVPATTFERAFVLWARATVYWAMKRFDDARALASRAEETFREYGDDVDAARVQILEGGIRFDEGDIAGARAVFDGALPIIEQFEDEETLARLLANLCTCDVRLGDIARGRTYGAHAAALFAKLGMDTEALRLFWSVAEALAVTGANDGALGQLQQTAARFERLGMLGVAADVSLDTVRFLLADGKYEEAARLAASLAARFRSENDAVDTAHAFAYFQEAATKPRATPALVDYVRFYLDARAGGEDVSFAPSDGLPN
jgi:tetratricopeptide (TPR) repeat protein